MKNVKKLVAMLLVVVMVAALFAGCQNTENTTTTGNQQTPATSGANGETNAPDDTQGNETPATDAPATQPANNGEVLNQIIYGSDTELSGDLGNAWWTNNATDAAVRRMIDDYWTVVTNQSGEFVLNETVCDGVESAANDDGSKTFTIKVKQGLKFNNGDPIDASNFVAYLLVAYSPAVKEAQGKVTTDTLVGAKAYQSGETKFISGVHLIDDYTFSVQVPSDYVPYFYELSYASVMPIALKQYASADLTVKDDGEGAYLDGGELKAEEVDAARYIYEGRISAGPYQMDSFDKAGLTCTLKINPNYGGNFEGQMPSVEKIVIVKAVNSTMMDQLKTGAIDVLVGLGDGDLINTALDLAETGNFVTNSYERNGYGKLMFQCDFGPTQFKSVRHAIALLLDRNEFANQFCQGFGSVVDGPYGLSSWMYQEAADELAERLNSYSYNPDAAVAELEADGWTLNENGEPYTDGIRYKEVTAEQAGDYKHNVTLADGRILMPLIIEWSSSEGNPVSELLAVMLANGPQVSKAGMQINQNIMSFDDLLNYMYRDASQGEQYGVKTYGMYNMGTSFSAAYDMSFSFVTAESNPEYYEAGWNSNYTDSKELDDLSMKMVYGVEAGDNESYLKVWVDFIDAWNEYLPEIPLYSNVYHDVMNSKIHNLEINSLFGFEYAVVYASVS
jgi:peptide/nickel transport system substrate-binding protein